MILGAPHASSILHVFPTFEAGGVQTRTRELIAAERPKRRHLIVTLDGARTDPSCLLDGVSHAWIPLPKSGSWVTTIRLRRVILREKPDLVLTYDWGAIDAVIANRISLRVPSVHHEDGVADDERQGEKLRRCVARQLILRWADRVVVPSRSREVIATDRWKISARKLVCIPNGVDTRRFEPADNRDAARDSWGVPRDALVVGTVSRLSKVKNVGRLLEAFHGLEPALHAHLVIGGDGPERRHLEAQARALGMEGRIHWLGHLEKPERIYPGFDVFALTSDREEQPRALLEAMACECAVVATRVGDISAMMPEVQQHFLVDTMAADPIGTLTRLLRSLLQDGELRSQLGRANRELVVSRFPLSAMMASYHAMYEAALR